MYIQERDSGDSACGVSCKEGGKELAGCTKWMSSWAAKSRSMSSFGSDSTHVSLNAAVRNRRPMPTAARPKTFVGVSTGPVNSRCTDLNLVDWLKETQFNLGSDNHVLSKQNRMASARN
jgi:hypothetical protein